MSEYYKAQFQGIVIKAQYNPYCVLKRYYGSKLREFNVDISKLEMNRLINNVCVYIYWVFLRYDEINSVLLKKSLDIGDKVYLSAIDKECVIVDKVVGDNNTTTYYTNCIIEKIDNGISDDMVELFKSIQDSEIPKVEVDSNIEYNDSDTKKFHFSLCKIIRKIFKRNS